MISTLESAPSTPARTTVAWCAAKRTANGTATYGTHDCATAPVSSEVSPKNEVAAQNTIADTTMVKPRMIRG